MDKIFHSTFNFFAYAVPGSSVIAAYYLLNSEFQNVDNFLKVASTINLGSGVLLLLFGYILGFAIYPIGRFLYKKIGFRIWRKKIHEDIPLFISEKYVLIREFSPNNFKYVEDWNMYCAMSHNLAGATLVILGMIGAKLFFRQIAFSASWAFALGILLTLFLIFLHRAVVFSIWAADDINSAIKQLRLADKARN